MAIEKTLGGDRLGSGKKQKVELHNYGMNSFNQEQDFKSSLAPGILYPFIKLIGTNHGTFDIDLDGIVRTIPTKGPLFASYKLQCDLFSVPFRLYQGILHNNPIDLGLNMSRVYLPKIALTCTGGLGKPMAKGSNEYNYQVNESALLKYLGISGWGKRNDSASAHGTVIESRKLQCVPMLAYYDIFKCYYSNKQEEKAYVLTPEDTPIQETAEITGYGYSYANQNGDWINNYYDVSNMPIEQTIYWNTEKEIPLSLTFYSKNGKWELLQIGSEEGFITLKEIINLNYAEILQNKQITDKNNPHYHEYIITLNFRENTILSYFEEEENANTYHFKIQYINNNVYTSSIKMRPFNLKNIDDMRNFLLSTNQLGTEAVIAAGSNANPTIWDETYGTDQTGLPYIACCKTTTEGISWNAFEQNGLVVKTYQSDLFNNWLDTEFIDGENGISAITAVDTTGGSFTMDTLNLAEKIYELLNRILVAGGTYQDWQEAVYGEGAIRMCETPMYLGGMSGEIVFEEVISNSETKVDGDYQPLGSLAGKGTLAKNGSGQAALKGGRNIHVKMDEPGYVMGIVSITPRICYSQGNDWDITELDTLDDLHKPSLDGIGFQNLIVEQMAWWNTQLDNVGRVQHRSVAGKQTAWINYQTAIDKCYGDFAKTDGYAFMVLNRNYEMQGVNGVKDITTYIDPSKYNYAFAYTDLASQNFWVQIHSWVTARRKMGAQQLPNL